MEQTICIFGDSIAWGAADPENGGWVAQLRRHFETNDDYDIDVYNNGISGDNTDDLLVRFKVECAAREPQIIIFAIGINDSYYYGSKDKPSVTIEKFQNNLQELVNQAKKFSSKIIFLGLTPVDESKTKPIPWDTSIFHDQENTILYNNKIKEVCKKNNILFINLLDKIDIEDIDDGVHPSPRGHKKIFLEIKKFLQTTNLVP